MDARELVEGGSYGPATLMAMGQAFDQGWLSIERHFGTDPQDIKKGRFKLARAVLAVTKDGDTNVEALKVAALQSMAMNYRKRGLSTDQG